MSKVLLINGSPHAQGCTFTALSMVAGVCWSRTDGAARAIKLAWMAESRRKSAKPRSITR